VDDLARGPHDEVRARLRNRIEGLLEEAERDYVHWYRGRTSAPAIQALTAQAESRRAAEVDRLLRRMPHLAGRDRELVEQMSRRLVAGLLHAPLTTLRDDDTGARERAARDLFSL
jgi:glutamyl-tRNA reductase